MQTVQKGYSGAITHLVRDGVPTSPYARLLDRYGDTLADWGAITAPWSSSVSGGTASTDDSVAMDVTVTSPAATLKGKRLRVDCDKGPPQWPVCESVTTGVSGKVGVRLDVGTTPVTISYPLLSYTVADTYTGDVSPAMRVEWKWTLNGDARTAATYFDIALQPLSLTITMGDFLSHYPGYRSIWQTRRANSPDWVSILDTAPELVHEAIGRHGQRTYYIGGEETVRPLLVDAVLVLLARAKYAPGINANEIEGYTRDVERRFESKARDLLRTAYMDPDQLGRPKDTAIRPRTSVRLR